jgi:hypothetical protein
MAFRVVILPIYCVVLERNLDNVSIVSPMYIGLLIRISDGGIYGASVSTIRRVIGMFLKAFNCSWSNLLSIEEKLKKKIGNWFDHSARRQ